MDNLNLSIEEMLKYSNKLYKKNKKSWGPATPESNILWVAWLVAEIGEVIDVIKKKGPKKIMEDKETRVEMMSELADCYMYLSDILNRYKITADEFSQAYRKKINYNLNRDFSKSKTKLDKEKNAGGS